MSRTGCITKNEDNVREVQPTHSNTSDSKQPLDKLSKEHLLIQRLTTALTFRHFP